MTDRLIGGRRDAATDSGEIETDARGRRVTGRGKEGKGEGRGGRGGWMSWFRNCVKSDGNSFCR